MMMIFSARGTFVPPGQFQFTPGTRYEQAWRFRFSRRVKRGIKFDYLCSIYIYGDADYA